MKPLMNDIDLKYFIDRKKELKYAKDSIRLNKNLLIAGDRGVGKTSFINALRCSLLKENEAFIFLDVRPFNLQSVDSNTILQTIAIELDRHMPRINNDDSALEGIRRRQNYIDSMSVASVGELLLIVEDYVKKLHKMDKKLVFVIDDLDKTSFEIDFLSGIRDSLWRLNVIFIIAVNSRQYRNFADSAMEPFFIGIFLEGFNESQTIKLIDERIQLASNREKKLGEIMDLQAISLVQLFSQGNPRKSLSICNSAFNNALFRRSVRVKKLDFYQTFSHHFNFSKTEKNILDIIAKYPKGLPAGKIFKILKGQNIQISRSRVSQMLGEFTSKGLIKPRKLGRYNYYKTVIPMDLSSK